MQVFFSNRVEKLYEKLKQTLFSNNDPFARRLIVVSNQAVKSWLMLTMAKDPELKVAAGVEITYLNEAIDKLTQKVKPPSHIELSLAIEIELRKMAFDHAVLRSYLKSKEGRFSKKGERRLVSLADSLARLFMEYGLYGSKMTAEWERSGSHWQALLWNRIKEKFGWLFSSEALQKSHLRQESTYQVHFFSLSFVSRVHLMFLMRAAKKNSMYFYLSSPCQSFWSDLSRKQQFDENGNFLLSNFGRLGRQMAKLLEESDVEISSHYVLPEDVLKKEEYQSLLFEEVETEKSDKITLLTAVQADMLLLRNAQDGSKIDLPSDHSIQIHSGANRKREIEILYDNLIHVMQTKGIKPADVIVMVPHLNAYEPYIKTVFNQRNAQIPFHFLDNKFLYRSPLAQGFMHLLKLPLGRWDAPSVMQLFRYDTFQKWHKLKKEDIEFLEQVFIETGISWGEDAFHRNELLQRDHGLDALHKKEFGTWIDGIDRLLASLVVTEGKDVEQNNCLDFLPVGQIEANRGPVLGKFLALFHSLKDDLDPLVNGSRKTWIEWCDYLKCLLQVYFGVHELSQEEEERSLWIWLARLRRQGRVFVKDLFSFDTVRRHLDASLQKEDLHSSDIQLNTVCFCSMLPMRAIPAKMICLIGLDEGIFPGKDLKRSLNLLGKRKDADYKPSQIDYDRYLFLEAILSARQYFYLSYIGVDGEKQKQPSILISELLSYLDSSYRIEGKLPSEALVYHHPFHSFDKSYFNGNTLFSYSKTNFLRARAFYGKAKKKPHRFIPEFIAEELVQNVLLEKIEVRQLADFARNPIKVYFNKALGIFISEQEGLSKEENFTLSRLDLAYLKKASLGIPIDTLIRKFEKKGMIPSGTFGAVAIQKIEAEAGNLIDNLAACGIAPDEIFKIILSDQIEIPIQDEFGNWYLPAVQIGDKQIIGEIPEVSKKGLIFHGKDDKNDVIKTWPQFLLFLFLVEKHAFSWEKSLIFTKSGKTKTAWFSDPKPYLEQYLNYFIYAQHTISPLIPEITYDVIQTPKESLSQKIQERMQNAFNPIYNDYVNWIGPFEIHDSWQHYAANLYKPLYQAWYPKKGSGL